MEKTIVHGRFEWDEDKARADIKKHKISFEAILPMFDDPLRWERYDWQNSTPKKNRYIGIGKIDGFMVVSSCYTDRNGRTRIINARRATSKVRCEQV